jgi:hypothetical protein
MMQTEGIVLGHHVSPERLKVYPSKTKIILKFPIPSNQRYVKNVLVYVGYYRQFTETFSKMAFPLLKLLSKDDDFCWNTNCQYDFQNLKQKLLLAPI